MKKRIVMCTEGGQPVFDAEVPENEIIGVLVGLMRRLPHLPIYVDGHLVPPEARATIYAALLADPAPEPAAAATAQPVATMEPAPPLETPKGIAELVNVVLFQGLAANLRIFEDLRRSQVTAFDDLRKIQTELMSMALEREKQFADECARQRAFMRAALKDIDLLDRSIAAKNVSDRFARARGAVSDGAANEEGLKWQDLLTGVMRVIQSLNAQGVQGAQGAPNSPNAPN